MKKWFILLLLLSGLVGIDSINSLVFANETTQMVRNGAHSHFPGHAAGTGLCVFAICFRQFQRPAL